METTVQPLSIAEFRAASKDQDTIILDTRSAAEFSQGFIPGSIFIGLEGRFSEWAGSLLPFNQPVLLITPPGREEETASLMTRVGFTRFAGYLDGGIETWKQAEEPMDMIINVEADELAMDIPFDPRLVVVDVRREAEFGDGHVAEATNIPLNELTDPASMGNIEEDQNLYVHCSNGYRSVIACSLLKRQGIHNLRNVVGGFDQIKAQDKIDIVKEDRILN